jgi:hypothetical protein
MPYEQGFFLCRRCERCEAGDPGALEKKASNEGIHRDSCNFSIHNNRTTNYCKIVLYFRHLVLSDI